MNKNGEGGLLDIVFGIVGAVAGGLTWFQSLRLIAAVIGVVATYYYADLSTAELRRLNRNKKPWTRCRWNLVPTLHNRLRYMGSWRQLRDVKWAEQSLLPNKL